MNLQGDLNHVTWPAYSIIIRTKLSYSQNPMIFQNKTFFPKPFLALFMVDLCPKKLEAKPEAKDEEFQKDEKKLSFG